MVAGRQLHLFRSRKQRGQAPPAPTEAALQFFLVDEAIEWLKAVGILRGGYETDRPDDCRAHADFTRRSAVPFAR
jgi:hypothetical protein